MWNKYQNIWPILAGVLISHSVQAAPVLYDQTITITDSQRPINFSSHGGTGINPYVFSFSNTPVPLTSTINITVFGEGDFDGLEDPPDTYGQGFQETLSVGMEGLGLALDGDTKLGPFGTRAFSLSGDFGFAASYFADGLIGSIYLAQGVDENISTDFLAMRVRYTYEAGSAAVPVPAAIWLMGSGLMMLMGAARFRGENPGRQRS